MKVCVSDESRQRAAAILPMVQSTLRASGQSPDVGIPYVLAGAIGVGLNRVERFDPGAVGPPAEGEAMDLPVPSHDAARAERAAERIGADVAHLACVALSEGLAMLAGNRPATGAPLGAGGGGCQDVRS